MMKLKLKYWLKKEHKKGSSQLELIKTWPESWNGDDPIENKLKQIKKTNSQSTQY
jgi:hypothetical protein